MLELRVLFILIPYNLWTNVCVICSSFLFFCFVCMLHIFVSISAISMEACFSVCACSFAIVVFVCMFAWVVARRNNGSHETLVLSVD